SYVSPRIAIDELTNGGAAHTVALSKLSLRNTSARQLASFLDLLGVKQSLWRKFRTGFPGEIPESVVVDAAIQANSLVARTWGRSHGRRQKVPRNCADYMRAIRPCELYGNALGANLAARRGIANAAIGARLIQTLKARNTLPLDCHFLPFFL